MFALLVWYGTTTAVSAQWRRITGLPATFYNEVQFVSRTTGWVTSQGNLVLRTTDGGLTWATSSLPGGTVSANRDICFLDASFGVVSGSDSVWKTTNGGSTWVGIGPPNRRRGSAVAWFRDANYGVVGVGECFDTTVTFYRTTDGGSSWSSVTYTTTAGTSVGGITYASGTFYASCEGGKMWASTDDGASWSYSNTGANGWQEDIVAVAGNLFIASANGSACGSSGGGVVLRSSSSGTSWSTTPFTSTIMWGVSMYSASSGWVCGDGGRAFRTSDGGANWSELSCGMIRTDAIDDIYFVDSTNGWAVGSSVYRYVGDSAHVVPDTIDFGDVIVQSRRDSSASVRSLGGDVSVSFRVIAGRDSTSFAGIAGLGSQVIPSCQQLPTTLRFAPLTEGPKIARLDYYIQGQTRPLSVVLLGRGVRPRIHADSVLRFDTILCVDRVIDSIPIENTGNTPLRITQITLTGVAAGAFGFDGPTLPISIPPGGRKYLVFRAVTRGSGPFAATAVLQTNEPDPSRSPWRVHLFAFRQEVAFGFDLQSPITIPSGMPGRLCITYTNTGNAPQTIWDILALDNDTTIRLLSPAPRTVVPVGRSVGICFEASKQDTALHRRRFRVRTMPCSVDTVLTLLYRGVAPIAAGPSSLAVRSSCGADKVDSLRIENAGSAPLALGDPMLSGPDASQFALVGSSALPDTLAPGDVAIVLVRFAPDDPDDFSPRTAELTIPTNDPARQGGWMRIGLTGTITIARVRTHLDTVDIGELCLGQWSRFITLPVYNDGTASAFALILSPDTSLHSFDGILPAVPFRAGGTDSILLRVRPGRSGRLVMPMTIRSGPCNLVDTVVVVGQVIGVSLSQPRTVTVGPVLVGSSGVGSVALTNTGVDAVTVTRMDLSPVPSEFSIVSPATPFSIASGTSVSVTIAARPTDTGAIETHLRVYVDGPCPHSDSTRVLAVGTRAAVATVESAIDIGSLSPCDATHEGMDTVTLRNIGGLPVDVTSIALVTGTAFTIVQAPSVPATIAAGGTVTIVVATTAALQSVGVDTLVCVVDQPENGRIAIPVRARRYRASASIRDSSGSLASAIDFGALLPCTRDTSISVRIVNDGDIADTFSVTVSGTTYGTATSPTLVLDSGGVATIRVVASADDAGSVGELIVRSSLCGSEWRVPIRSSTVSLSTTLQSPATQPFVKDLPARATAQLISTADVDLRVVAVWVVDPLGEFATVSDYAGTVLAQGDTLLVEIAGTPRTEGLRSIHVGASLEGGCTIGDSAEIVFTVLGPNERPRVRLTGQVVVGRWGTVARIPISLHNTDRARIDSISFEVAVDPTLLELQHVDLASHLYGVLKIEDVSVDGSQGRLRGTLRSTGATTTDVAVDSAVVVDAEVLRGPSVETSVQITVTAAPAAVDVRTDSGRFILEDYCDAHGRRLTATGVLALDQNHPNPFNPVTTIEFETPFAGRVVLSVFDPSGREVRRIVDQDLSAGRRRVQFEAGDLASGLYTLRMSIGLQVLSRRMLLVR